MHRSSYFIFLILNINYITFFLSNFVIIAFYRLRICFFLVRLPPTLFRRLLPNPATKRFLSSRSFRVWNRRAEKSLDESVFGSRSADQKWCQEWATKKKLPEGGKKGEKTTF